MPDLRIEMAFGADPDGDPAAWSWTDVSDRVHAQTVTITRGPADESSDLSPASVSLELDNPDGHLTPGHPASPYYPHVDVGVPCRVWVRGGERHALMPDTATARARTASSTAMDIAGDLDVRVELALDRIPAQWYPGAPAPNLPHDAASQEIIGRYSIAGGSRMWRLLVGDAGQLWLGWSPDGVQVTEVSSLGVLPYPPARRFAVRATLQVDDGAGRHVVRYYTAPTLDGPWAALGAPVIRPGVTSIATGLSAPLDIADIASVGFPRGAGRYYRAEVRRGIDGEVVAAPDFRSVPEGVTTWTDSAGRLWGLQGGAHSTTWRRRLVGEVRSWEPTWPWGDLSQPPDPLRKVPSPGEARVAVTVAGYLARLDTMGQPLQSTLRRRLSTWTEPVPVAYWPCEDGSDASEVASGLPGGQPMQVSGWQMAADDSLPGAGPLPTWGDSAAFSAPVPPAPPGEWWIECVYRLPELPAAETTLLEIHSTGTWAHLRITVTTALLRVYGTSAGGDATTLLINGDMTAAVPPMTGGWQRLRIREHLMSGAPTLRVGWAGLSGSGHAYDGAAGTIGQLTRISRPAGPGMSMSIGHIAASSADPAAAYVSADIGFAGERAITRIRRLAREEGIPVAAAGVPAESVRMGPQRIATALELITECADADGGMLVERRAVPGLDYRPRHLLYGREPIAVLDAQQSEIANPLSPALDDQRRRNRITASRPGGSSYTAEDLADIARTGIRPDQADVNVASDEQLAGVAHWRLHLASWPGMRYPQLSADVLTAPQHEGTWLDADSGDRVQVVGLPPQHPPGTVDLAVEGVTETLSGQAWTVTAACSPAGPWTVGQVAPEAGEPADGPVHVDTDGTRLAAPVGEADTTITIEPIPPQTAHWVHTGSPAAEPEDWPVDIVIGGERMTVTATGEPSSGTQTMTVARAVNGIAKSHAAGAAVELADPMIVAL